MPENSSLSTDLEVSLLDAEKQKTITAIKKLNLRVTPTELAAESGLSINRASFWLNKIAGDTRGRLEVAADGTIFYTFAPDFTNAYLQRGIKKTGLIVGFAIFQVTYWLLRVSFGFVLVLSLAVIVIIIVALIVVAIAAIFGDSGGDGGFEFGDGFFDLDFLWDALNFTYSPSHTAYYNSVPTVRRAEYTKFVKEHPKGNFFLECFSFLFGDGAPNSNIEEVRWREIARMIRLHGGVVSTEQIAPFLDGDRSDSGMILSVLAQYNGRPEVTKSGYIVYVFPDLMTGVKENYRSIATPPTVPYLEEEHWQFSAFDAGIQAKVLILACLNFAGSWWLFKHIATISMLHPIAYLIDFLITYAVIFLAIPAGRLLVITVLNHRIDERNEKRRQAYELVRIPKDDVLEEIEEAREIRAEEVSKLNYDQSIVFNSDKDSLEQQFQ
ncbi:MAG: hypothetical protein SGJ27_22755 [Candidatus Melainabacteria bacterium]|nr:hypothetical protein [Candidatus Melainabacteria bacterium]